MNVVWLRNFCGFINTIQKVLKASHAGTADRKLKSIKMSCTTMAHQVPQVPMNAGSGHNHMWDIYLDN
jgi:hypothetical protein